MKLSLRKVKKIDQSHIVKCGVMGINKQMPDIPCPFPGKDEKGFMNCEESGVANRGSKSDKTD